MIQKFYDKESGKFIYRKEYSGTIFEEKTFDSFYRFVKYLKGDLSDSNLFDCDFKNVDLKKYNLKGAGIKKSVLIEQGIYDNSFYENNVNIGIDYAHNIPLDDRKLTKIFDNNLIVMDKFALSDFSCVYYVTDLHLDHKIKMKFPNCASEYEIRQYIKEIVKEIVSDIHQSGWTYILIGGDVSFSIEVSRLFYEELAKVCGHIIAILGNHELWGYGIECLSDERDSSNFLRVVVESYQKMFENIGIIFLQNAIFCFRWRDNIEYKILTEGDLEKMAVEEIRDTCTSSYITIFGGIGFSGYNESFNSTNGIYRDTINNLDEERIQTERFERIYRKIVLAASNVPIIVLTHMPKESWTSDAYNPNWTYVNGHTHRNVCFENNGAMIYSDNQIGYEEASFRLKYFLNFFGYDPFKNYSDGIYEVTRDQYIDFYHGLKCPVTFNRKNCVVYMLKNSGAYCFIFKGKTKNLSILNGGSIKILDKKDLSYYYENLKIYADSVKLFMSRYNKVQKELSNAVKAFGGDGNIHGCIVDIDYYNHIFLNPIDGKLTPYYAESIIDKWVYDNVASLLFSKKKELYRNFRELTTSEKKDTLTVIGSKMDIVEDSCYVPETDMYGSSRIISGLQYTTNFNVVRVWNDEIIKMNENDRKRNIVYELLKKKND